MRVREFCTKCKRCIYTAAAFTTNGVRCMPKRVRASDTRSVRHHGYQRDLNTNRYVPIYGALIIRSA